MYIEQIKLNIPCVLRVFWLSQTIKTPVMTLPLLPGLPLDDAKVLAGKLQRLSLPQVMAQLCVKEVSERIILSGLYVIDVYFMQLTSTMCN